MLIVGKVETQKVPINLILPKENFGYPLPYHCMRCKSYMFSINRDIAAIWMGEGYPAKEIPKGMGWLEFYCRGCKRMYNFYLQ